VAGFGVRRQLGEHAHQAVRDRLPLASAAAFDEVHDGLHGHAFRRVVHEGVAPRGVAAHLHQPAQRLGLSALMSRALRLRSAAPRARWRSSARSRSAAGRPTTTWSYASAP
jgi:hypothetical protein